MNLYINFEFIAGLLSSNGGPDQELPLFKFLQDLCNGINNALGGVNKLEPVIKEDYKITIIDQTLSFPEVKDTVSLEVYGYNPDDQISNFVKDVKFVSKITPQLASMISIGATAAGRSTSEIDGTAFSKWSEGLVDRFAETISEPNGLDLIAEQEQAEKTREKYAKRFLQFQSVGSPFEEAVESGLSFFANVRLATNTFFGTENRTDNFYGTSAAETAATFEALDNDLNEKRIVADGYSNITGEMFFKEYLDRSIEFEKNEIKNQTFDQNTISQLTSTNYAIYLIKAFGGISGEIKVRFFESTPNQIITGLGSQTSFTSRTSTTENLQVNISQSRYLEFDDVFISQGKSAYKTYINTLNNNRYTETKTPSSEIGFIPLSFELVLDGISGIKIYNKLKINNEFLPSNYPESLSFIITKVNHNISNNSWDTSLSTISIPKTEPYKYETIPTQTNTENIASGPIGPFPDNGSPFQLLDARNGRQAILLDNLLKELNPKSQPIFRQFFDTLKSKYSGYKFIITSVGRSWEKSWNFKYNKSNSNYNPRNGSPGTSPHNYNLALDMIVETPQSTTTKRTLGIKQGDLWKQEGIPQIAATIPGLEWGGNYKDFDDSVHFGYRYSTSLLYNQVVTQVKVLDPTITFPIKGDARGLADCKKIDKLISSGKIKLNII